MSSFSTPRSRRGTAFILLASVLFALVMPGGASFAAGGPIQWCPGTLPRNDAGCTDAASIQEAVDLAAADSVPGTIFATNITTTDTAVTVTRLKGVTFTGGATGGQTTIDGTVSITGSSNIRVDEFIVTGGITISGANGSLDMNGNNGPLTISASTLSKSAGNGLFVTGHNGDISLTKITATSNADSGIFLGLTGTVTGSGIKTTGNQGIGLRIVGNTSVTLTGVTASKNLDNGIEIGPVSGAVTLNDIASTKNGGAGLEIQAGGVITLGTVKSKLNRFDGNGAVGLNAGTTSTLLLSDISASKNTNSGAIVSGTTGVTINTVRGKLNRFDSNGDNGLFPQSNGPVALSDISASKNFKIGMRVSTGGTLDVTTVRSNMNHFDNNGAWGIFAATTGAMTLADITANGNFDQGIQANITSGLTLTTNRSKLNHFDKNHAGGISVNGAGDISLEDISASKNLGFGAALNTSETIQIGLNKAQKNVFDKNTNQGVLAHSGGQILITGSSFSSNTGIGAEITVTNAGVAAGIACSILKGNKSGLDINATMNAADLLLGGVTLSKPDQSTVSISGGSLVVNQNCVL